MTEYRSSFGILGRLGVIATLLLAFSSTGTPGASLEIHDLCVPATWDGSDASVTTSDNESSRQRAIEFALVEVRATAAILELDGLCGEPAFGDFLDHVRAALDTHEASPRLAEHITTLASSLAVARTSLHSQVASLAQWTAIADAASFGVGRYLRVPQRFVSQASFSVAREVAPTAEDAATLFELDHLLEA